MPPADLLSLFVRPLNRLGWAYAVTGAVGSMFYAEPRFTNDIDVVVRIPAEGAAALRGEFHEPDFYSPSPEEISIEALRPTGGHLADPPVERDLLLRRLVDAGLDTLFRRLFP